MALMKHDGFFKSNMSDLHIAAQVLRAHLPQDVVLQMDLNKLKIESGNQVDQKLKQSHMDILYSVPFGPNKALVYVLTEHQTKSDRFMPFRLLHYGVNKWARLLQKRKLRFLPPIFFLVIYNGPGPWSGPRSLLDLFEPRYRDQMYAQLVKPMNLIDLKELPDKRLLEMGKAGIFEYLMKHIHGGKEEQALLEILPKMKHIEQQVDVEFIVRCFEYLAITGNVPRLLDIVEEHFSERTRGETMTTVEIYAEKARQEILATIPAREEKARQQAKEEIARKMMARGSDQAAILDTTGIDISLL